MGKMDFKRYLFLAFVFLLPVDGTTALSLAAGPAHVGILDLLLALMLLSIFMEGALKGVSVPPFVGVLCALFLVAACLSSVSLLYIPADNMGYDVKVTLNLVEYTVLFFVASLIITDMDYLKKLLAAFCISVLLLSVATLIKSVWMDFPGGVRGSARPFIGPFYIGVTGLIHQGMVFSTLVLAVLPFLLKDTIFKSRGLRYAAVALLMAGSVISYSRTLWLAAAVQLLAFLPLSNLVERSALKKAVTFIAMMLASITLAVYGRDIYRGLIEIRPETVEQREAGFYFGMGMVTKDPLHLLMGAGKGQYFASAGDEGVPHNFFLDLLVSKGLCTLVVVMLILYIISMNLLKVTVRRGPEAMPSARSYAVFFLIMLVGMFVEGLFAPITNSIIFWTAVAMGCAFISMDKAVRPKEGAGLEFHARYLPRRG